jgi:hypothetical protein
MAFGARVSIGMLSVNSRGNVRSGCGVALAFFFFNS